MAPHTVRPSNRKSLAIGSNQMEKLRCSASLIAIRDVCMTSQSFIKELKGRFAQWYNQRHDRYGVLWAERFKSVLLEGGEALAAVAAYLELNPVRAGLCTDPKDYRYCGYAEALAKGSVLTRQGISTILGQPETISWKELSRQYRKYLFVKGSYRSANKPAAFDLATAQRVVEEQNGELPLPQRLLCRIRYFTDGVILGSQGFVESHFGRLKEKLGYRRHKAATRLTALGSPDLWDSAISGSEPSIRFLPVPLIIQP